MISEMSDAELVKAVAEEVMGWRDCGEYYSHKINPTKIIFTKETTSFSSAWQPLTDFNSAFQVVERMRELGWNIFVRSSKGYYISNLKSEKVFLVAFSKHIKVDIEAYTPAYQIGRAILQAALGP